MCRKTDILLVLFLLFARFSTGISQQTVTIDSILLKGNTVTQDYIIYRESSLKIGDTLSTTTLDTKLEECRLQLLSTGLFNSLEIDTSYNGAADSIVLAYSMQENWYLFPVPILELADRNFNVWWQEFDHKINRLIYGFRIAHYNLTGRRDKAKLVLHTGYSRKAELTYELPNVLGNKNWGIGANLFYSDRKEIGYITDANKTLFYKADDERILLKRFRVGMSLLYRPNTYVNQVLRLEYHRNTIDPLVSTDLNPDYFLNAATRLQFLYFEYDVEYDRRDYGLYPRAGYKLRFNIKKEGLFVFEEIDNTFLLAEAMYFHAFNSRLSVGTQWRARTNFSRQQIAYANNTGLGWDAFTVMGYDLYVMDGPDFVINKNHLSLRIIEQTFDTWKRLPPQFRKIPIQAYLRFNIDFAYANEPTYVANNTLNNRVIYGFGPSLDVLLYYNYLFSIEYGINQLGDRGFYFKNSIAF